ncbi:MAG: hypothetical protein II956_05885 [Bacteroidales bacterium]|nr:hypothetical protein [Bacteroidales bacterium]
MDNQKIYDKIRELAQQNFKDNTVLSRSDLAWELKEFGIENDSELISKLVWEAYQKSSDKDIFKSLVNNEKNTPVIDECKIPALLEEGKQNDVFEILKEKLKISDTHLSALQNITGGKFNEEIIQKTSDLLNFISGKNAIEKVKNEATAVFEKYSVMTKSYTEAKTSVKTLTKDFVNVRQNATMLFRRYALSLTDIFGENIKATMPEVFDFDKIEFLDTESMLKSAELSYNSVFGKCTELSSQISDGFVSALKLSASQITNVEDKRLGLVVAGLNMLSHYIKSTGQTSSIKKEAEELKASVAHDAAVIKSDSVRLTEIFKTINDVFIPKAEIFAKTAPEVFDEEFLRLSNAVYSTERAKELKKRRDEILEELHSLEKSLADSSQNLSYYSSHIQDCNNTLQSLEKQYNEAKKTKPEPPSGLGNVISLGSKKKQYERAVYDWEKNCRPLVSKYEDLIVDVKIDGEELAKQKELYEKNKKRYDELKSVQKEISRELSSIITADENTKAQIVAHLEDIVKLLMVAKEISSSKLDDRLLKTVDVKKFDDIKLPENLAQAVNDFKENIKKDIQKETKPETKEVLEKGFELCNQLAQLEAMKLNYKLSNEHYENEFNKIKAEFEEKMKLIDDKNAALVSLAKQINTAQNKDDLKTGLLQLLEGTVNFSAEDWDDFLSGKKTLEI